MQTRSLLTHLSLVAAGIVLAGCAGTPAAFPIRTDPKARSLLTGEWAGSYQGGPGGRSGSITFTLQGGDSSFSADGEHAHGDVLMIPNAQGAQTLPPDPAAARDEAATKEPELLSIDFVRARGTRLTGTLKPYLDPDCNCMISARFTGEIAGDVIKGTFTTTSPDGAAQTGEWKMERKKP